MLPDADTKGPRKLPSLYMGPTLFFADRSIEQVSERFRLIDSFVQRSLTEAVYTLQAVRLGELYGLYARDFFNRHLSRRRLQRLGLEFSRDPFVVFRSERFEASDWGSVEARFVIFADPAPADPAPYSPTPAESGFSLMTYRMGEPHWDEVRAMLKVAASMIPLAKEDHRGIIDRLEAERAVV